jgi:phosphate transport system substrate-binding protein
MKRNINWSLLISIFALSLLPNIAQAVSVVFGVGATFPKLVYVEWGKKFKAETGTDFIYFARGSGKGVDSIAAGKSDFGATDKPLNNSELAKYNLIQFPALIGGVIPVVNIKNVGPGQLQLDGPVLARIYMGKISRWNDPEIAALNPKLSLPNEMIKVFYRADKSGSTFTLTDYLSKTSDEWKSSLGTGSTVLWKVGEGVEGGGDLAAKISITPNSIAYADPATVSKMRLAFVKVRNREGVFTSPNIASFTAAAANAAWSAANGFELSLTNQPGRESWPISTATFILISRNPSEPNGAVAALKFFDWAFSNGSGIAQSLGFVSIPANLPASIRDTWKAQIKSRKGQSLWQ